MFKIEKIMMGNIVRDFVNIEVKILPICFEEIKTSTFGSS